MRYPSLALTTLTLLGAACGGAEPSGPAQSGGAPAAIAVASATRHAACSASV